VAGAAVIITRRYPYPTHPLRSGRLHGERSYKSEKRIIGCQSLLDLAQQTEQELGQLHPRDRIDVQSFIWVVGAYTETDIARDQADQVRA
jgi:hypothetical protein